MEKDELIDMLKSTSFANLKLEEKSFADLDKMNYTGVYILCEKQKGEIVYIGSAYSKESGLKGRLSSHISKTKKSSLREHITKENRVDINYAVDYIKSLVLYVIEYIDLEQALIEIGKPKYNKIHKGKVK